jgi:hypothetical protein
MDNAYTVLEFSDEPVRYQVRRSRATVMNKEPAFGGTVLSSLSLGSQNKVKVQRQLTLSPNLLSRHHPDARVALQQSPILQDDIYKLIKDRLKIKAEV